METKKTEINNWNCMPYIIVIIILCIVIAIWAFFMWKNYNNTNNNTVVTDTNTDTSTWNQNNTPVVVDNSDLIITIIDDERCINCQTDAIVAQLKQTPFLATSTIEEKDFKDEWVSEYLQENNITMLPAIIFSRTNVDTDIDPYLQEIPSKEYSLAIGANFNPFLERSENGFLLLDKEKYQKILDNSYIKWNTDTKITWLEYSDVECPYCAKLHTSGTIETITEKYWDDINRIYNHFPLDFHENAIPWAQILECIWESNWSDAFYKLLEVAYAEGKSDKDYLITEAEKLWVNKANLDECLESGKYKEKVQNEQNIWASLFWIQWTPWNVLINNETLEYEIISWAYPTESFIAIIDKLLGE